MAARSSKSASGSRHNLAGPVFAQPEPTADPTVFKIKHPSEVLKKGDTVDAQVLSIDAENQRLSLGLKQLQTGIWKEFFDKHHVGDIVEGKVVRLTNFGAFVELADGTEIKGDAYVLALGSYSPRFASRLGFRLPVYPVKGQVFVDDKPAKQAEADA